MKENSSVDSKIKNLLNLQEYDIERLKLELQLRMIPKDVLSVKARIEEIKAAEASSQNEIKQWELKCHDLDRQLHEAEDRVKKYKTQQMEVKKNEEYLALTKTIEREEVLINKLSDDQLELLAEIDEFREKKSKVTEEHQEQIQAYQAQITHLQKQENELITRLEKLKEAIEEASMLVDPVYLKKYQQVVKQLKRGPYVVALEGNRCHGCHLTVSNEVVGAVRQNDEQPHQCDNCSRILYLV